MIKRIILEPPIRNYIESLYEIQFFKWVISISIKRKPVIIKEDFGWDSKVIPAHRIMYCNNCIDDTKFIILGEYNGREYWQCLKCGIQKRIPNSRD